MNEDRKHKSCVCDNKKKKPYTINNELFFLCSDCAIVRPRKKTKKYNT